MFERQIITTLLRYIDTPELLLLTGARQTGKTTALRQLNDKLGQQGKIVHYITLEDPEYLRLLNEHPDRIWQIIPRREGVHQVVMIDEIQYLQNPAHFLKYHFDLNRDRLKLIVTGSSAFYLDKHFDDSLAGRKRLFHLPTLNVAEFLTFRGRQDLAAALDAVNVELPDLKGLPIAQRREILSLSQEYLLYGGYPAVVLAATIQDKQDILYDLFTSFLKRDFLESGITQVDKAYHLFKLLAFQIGGELNKNSLANEIGISKPVLESMLTTLQSTFHLNLVRPFYRGNPKELRKMPKLYLMDLGMRNAVLKNYALPEDREDIGKLYENFIYRYFHDYMPRSDIQYWRTQSGQEVDFIIDGKRGFEVKWNGRQLKDSKYAKFMDIYPEIKLSFIVRNNSTEATLLF